MATWTHPVGTGVYFFRPLSFWTPRWLCVPTPVWLDQVNGDSPRWLRWLDRRLGLAGFLGSHWTFADDLED